MGPFLPTYHRLYLLEIKQWEENDLSNDSISDQPLPDVLEIRLPIQLVVAILTS
jgi:hypothetical protein